MGDKVGVAETVVLVVPLADPLKEDNTVDVIVDVTVDVIDDDPLGDTVGVVETLEDPEDDATGLEVALVLALEE